MVDGRQHCAKLDQLRVLLGHREYGQRWKHWFYRIIYEVVFEVNPATDRFRKIISKPDALIQFPEEGPMSQVRDFIATDKICEADRSIFLTETQLGHVLAKWQKRTAFRQISPLSG